MKNKELEKRNFTCVPNVEYSNKKKFLYGSVLQVNNLNYFVPVSTKTGKNPQYNLDIKTDDKKNRVKGSLRFPYMIPVPPECLIKLDIKSILDTNDRIRTSKELAFCRRKRDTIETYAKDTYEDVVSGKNAKLVSNSCDFKLLESAYFEWITPKGIELSSQAQPKQEVAQQGYHTTLAEMKICQNERKLQEAGQQRPEITHKRNNGIDDDE